MKPRIRRRKNRRLQKSELNGILLILIVAFGSISLSLAFVVSKIPVGKVPVRNIGKIVIHKIWDDCNRVNGWRVHSSQSPPYTGENIIETDTTDKIEGNASLKMTFAATGANWGGYFVKEGHWNFSETPILRMRLKCNSPPPDKFTFAYRVPGTWSAYNLTEKITSFGEWLTIDFDLRLPEKGEQFPDLTNVVWVEFSCWQLIQEPFSFNIDYIEALPGPKIPLDARIRPESAWTVVGAPVTFNVDVKGGIKPYSYQWSVNGTIQLETSSTFTFTPTAEGEHTVTCVVKDAEGSNLTLTASVTAVVVTPPPPSPPSVDVFKSEIRGVYISNWMLRNPIWDEIAETCLNYGINTIVIQITPTEIWDSSTESVKDYPPLREAINTFHNYGFNVHTLVNVAYNNIPGMTVTLPDGSSETWLCLTKNKTRQAWKAMLESLVGDYEIDGLMFDYIRWKHTRMCFCDECKEKFIADTGLTDVNWPDDCLEGGRYYWDFIQWRLNPITEFVGDAVGWMKAIKPDIIISACVFTAFSNCGNYWVTSIGQHTADWVDKGYLDFVTPMMYTTSAGVAVSYMLDSMNFYTGGAEGKIPMVPFITNVDMSKDEYTPMPVETFVDIVRQLKENGADGWIIWRYGGPGFENDPFRKFPDIRPHLAGLIDAGLMEPVWAIQNLTISVNSEKNEATISWVTTIPTTGRIEYSNQTIFNGTIRYGDFGRPIYYKDIDYIGGKIIENTTLSTTHVFVIPITNQTEFRIQSVDANGVTITSKPISIQQFF